MTGRWTKRWTRRWTRRWNALRSDERGFTLVELLIAGAMLVVVVGATLDLLTSTNDVTAKDQQRPAAIAEAQVGLARMTRELRQATHVFAVGGAPIAAFPASGSSIEVQKTIGGVTMRVLYDCGVQPAGTADFACVRSGSSILTAPLSSTGGERILPHVLNGTVRDPGDPVFTLSAADFVAVRVVVPESGGASNGFTSSLALAGGVFMPNLGSP